MPATKTAPSVVEQASTEATPEVLQQIQALLAGVAPRPMQGARQINYSTHQGSVPQAQFASPDDILATAGRYGTYEDMAAAERHALRDHATMRQRSNGSWYRRVQRHTGGAPVVKDGHVFHVKEWVERPVALSLREARENGTDYFDGSSWVRGGLKRESERFTAFAAHRNVEEFLEPASANETAAIRSMEARRMRDMPTLPEADATLAVAGAVVESDEAGR